MKKAALLGISLFVIIVLDLFTLMLMQKKTEDPTLNYHEIARSFYQSCSTKGKSIYCYEDLLSAYTTQHSLQEAQRVLRTLQQIDSTVEYCHTIAHKIAQTEVKKDPQRWKEIAREVDPMSCTRGFIHGVIEEATVKNPDFLLSSASMLDMCESISGNSTFPKNAQYSTNCFHAIGHLLLVQEKADIDKSLKVCMELPPSYQYHCAEGVFMENTNRENLSYHGVAERVSWDESLARDQEALCRDTEGKIASACWNTAANIYGSLSRDAKTLFSDCKRAPLQYDQEQCYLHASAFALFHTFHKGSIPSEIFTYCDVVSGEASKGRCVDFIVTYLVAVFPQFQEVYKMHCNSLTALKKRCLSMLESEISEMGLDSQNRRIE